MQAVVEEAEESYFDGNYENAARLIREAEKWLDNSANRRGLAQVGQDHSVLKAMLTGLRAEILFAQGEQGRARAALRHAEAVLKNRRNVYVNRRVFPPFLWQYEAFLSFVRGDLMRPIPDFGLASDPSIPDELRQEILDRGNPSEAIGAYRNAEGIMAKPQAMEHGNPRFNRLEGRLFTSLARVKVLKAGAPGVDELSDAEAFLERAEAAFGRNPFWKTCVKQETFGAMPLAFKDINANDLDPTLRLDLKRLFSQTIHDWLGIQLLRVELAAFKEQQDFDAMEELVTTTEQHYDRIVGFVISQFRESHPRVQEARLSRGRWFLALSRNPAAPPETRFSWLQDCLLAIEGIAGLGSSDAVQKKALELAALVSIVSLDDQFKRLDGGQRETYAKRIEELQEELQSKDKRGDGDGDRREPRDEKAEDEEGEDEEGEA